MCYTNGMPLTERHSCFLIFFKPLNVNSGLKCKFNLITKKLCSMTCRSVSFRNTEDIKVSTRKHTGWIQFEGMPTCLAQKFCLFKILCSSV